MKAGSAYNYKPPKFWEKNERKIVCLSINGGGIRGIIPALILMEMEKRLLSKDIHTEILEHIDIFAGTSVGSILSGLMVG
jgi:patatin-like phospholipase/acyl hydrolase